MGNGSFGGRAVVMAAVSLVALGCPNLAWAQQAGDQPAAESSSESGEILVTARKREETLQSVPIAITAFTEATIEAAGIDSVEEIAQLTPGFTFTPLFGGGAATPVIRGQSTTIGEPNVGFFLDGVYQSTRSLMDAVLGDDIARVEIVKGPQSALYGRNTFGGAVNIISRPPGNDMSLRATAEIGEYGSFGLKASANFPLIDDKLFARFGVNYRKSDGYFTNNLNGQNLDTRRSAILSGTIEARPSDALTIRLRVAHDNTDDGDDAIVFADNNARPFNLTGAPFPAANQIFIGELKSPTTFAVTPGHNDRDLTASSLAIDLDLGGVTLTSITGYNDLHIDAAVDLDYSAVRARYTKTINDTSEVSQELRLTSNGDSRFSWLAGAYYFKLRSKTHLEDFWDADALPFASNLALPGGLRRQLLGGLINDLTETTENYAVFGQIGYKITDQIRLTAEGRWNTETKTVNSTDASQLTRLVTGTYVNSRKFQKFLPRVTLDFQATDDLLIYASAAQAQKAGGFNVVTVSGGILPSERTYDPETAWSYELGAKTSWMNGRLTLNVAGYYIDWSDQIVRALGATFATLNVNAGQTTVKGVEIEMRARPVQGLDLSAGVAYTDSAYDRYTFGTLALIGMNPVLDGKRLQYVSKWQANASAQYVMPLSDSVNWFSRVDISHQSDQSAVQTTDATLGAATNVNARTGVDFGKVSLRLFVNNLTKEDASPAAAFTPSAAQHLAWVRGALGQGPLVGLAAFGGAVSARAPRTWGATVGFKF
jgi:iron complex outermembrane receptor protein